MGICRGLDGRVIDLKIFEPSGENPYLCGHEQCRVEGFIVHVICYVILCCWVIQNELLGLLLAHAS